MLNRLVREPLVHFLVLGAIVFAAYHALNRTGEPEPDKIVVTPARVEQLAGLFAKTWQRPPTSQELKGLVDDYVKEEILYREALTLGLEKNDTVIRRRLRQKMEFLNDAAATAVEPSESELGAYLDANPQKFEVAPQTTFEQVFLSPQRRGESIDTDAASIIEALNTQGGEADPTALGDPTLLPSALGPASQRVIAQTFGPEFASALKEVPVGPWTGPVKSTFGSHVVRVKGRTPGSVPELSEVRDAVVREWFGERRKKLEEDSLTELLKRYDVVIEPLPEANGSAKAAQE